jgi:ABC-type transporter Mla subunit MlaD
MMQNENQFEPGIPELIDLLKSQGEQYNNLLTLLDSFNASANVNDTHSQAILNSIQYQLSKLKTSGGVSSRLGTHLGREVTANSPELQGELSRQEGLLRNCLERIAGLEQDFVQRKKRLQPELDESAKRRSMQHAYKRSLGTG